MSVCDIPADVEIFTDREDVHLAALWRSMPESAARLDPLGTWWWARADCGLRTAPQPYVVLLRRGANHRDQVATLIEALSWLHQKRWCKTPFPSYFADKESGGLPFRIAEEAFDAGTLHPSAVFVDQRAVAAGMGDVVGATFCFHCVAHDNDFAKYSPGRTLMSYLLDNLLADGRVNRFSYLDGEECYKLLHASGQHPLCRLDMTRSCSRALIVSLGASCEQAPRRRSRAGLSGESRCTGPGGGGGHRRCRGRSRSRADDRGGGSSSCNTHTRRPRLRGFRVPWDGSCIVLKHGVTDGRTGKLGKSAKTFSRPNKQVERRTGLEVSLFSNEWKAEV